MQMSVIWYWVLLYSFLSLLGSNKDGGEGIYICVSSNLTGFIYPFNNKRCDMVWYGVFSLDMVFFHLICFFSLYIIFTTWPQQWEYRASMWLYIYIYIYKYIYIFIYLYIYIYCKVRNISVLKFSELIHLSMLANLNISVWTISKSAICRQIFKLDLVW